LLLSIAGAEHDEMNSLTPAERIKLEQERLSRQKRRNEELDSPDVKQKDSAQKSVKRIKIGSTGIADNEIIEISDDDDDDDDKHASAGSKAQASTSRAEISKASDHGTMFWEGESRSVRNQLVSNPAKTFSLEEIVGEVSQLVFRLSIKARIPRLNNSLFPEIGARARRRRFLLLGDGLVHATPA
jgi:hypothetical protein